MRCIHCGEYHVGIPQSCKGHAWFVHEDGRPPGVHESTWAAFQSGEIELKDFDRHNYAAWKHVEIPSDVEWFGILREKVRKEREEAVRWEIMEHFGWCDGCREFHMRGGEKHYDEYIEKYGYTTEYLNAQTQSQEDVEGVREEN